MTDRGGDPPIDLATLQADDALLDALARGSTSTSSGPIDVSSNGRGPSSGSGPTDVLSNGGGPSSGGGAHPGVSSGGGAHPAVSSGSGPSSGEGVSFRGDDLFLGGDGGGDDPLAGLLAEWRDDLDADLPPLRADVAAASHTERTQTPGADTTDAPQLLHPLPPLRADVPGVTDITDISQMSDAADVAAEDRVAGEVVRLERRRGRGLRRALAGVAAAAVLLAGGALAANRSDPDGPLWPLTQVLYPEQAHERAAEQAITQAAEALANGDADAARRLLDTAAREAGRVDDDAARQRLLERIGELRRSLPDAATPPAPTATATPAATPGVTAGQTQAPGATATPAPGGTPGANPGGGTQPGGPGPLLPGLPTQLVPSVPGLPLPTPALTSLLPLPKLGG